MSTGLFLDSSTRTGPISIACKACEPRRMPAGSRSRVLLKNASIGRRFLLPKIQDPRFPESFFILSFLRHEFRLEFRLDFRLECHSLDSCYPRSKIQDFQKAFLGNLGINPRSKIQDFQKTFLGCTCRILDAPKIQDPRFPDFFSWMQAVNLGCTQDPRSKISRKLFLDALAESWMHPRSKIQDFQKTFLGCTCRILDAPKILDLGFIPRFPRFPRKVFWKSWILDLGCIQDFQPASKILQVHPRKVFWKSWILDLGCIQDFQPASKKKFLGILDLGSWVHPRFCKCIQEKFSGNLGSWILGLSQDFQEKLSGNLGSWILGSRNRDYDTQVWSQVWTQVWTHVSRNSI